jgi:hypothetical protein
MPQFARPQVDISNSGPWVPVGAGSLSDCLNDVPNSDATGDSRPHTSRGRWS